MSIVRTAVLCLLLLVWSAVQAAEGEAKPAEKSKERLWEGGPQVEKLLDAGLTAEQVAKIKDSVAKASASDQALLAAGKEVAKAEEIFKAAEAEYKRAQDALKAAEERAKHFAEVNAAAAKAAQAAREKTKAITTGSEYREAAKAAAYNAAPEDKKPVVAEIINYAAGKVKKDSPKDKKDDKKDEKKDEKKPTQPKPAESKPATPKA